MKFRPCIDIHNGKVKQIVGSSLLGSDAEENFVSDRDAGYYAGLYRADGLTGGHIILLNPAGTQEYERDLRQAAGAFAEYPRGMQIGGGVTADNAEMFLDMGASHVIVTSYVFKNGRIDYENLRRLVSTTGKERLVLDLSCRKPKVDRDQDQYYIVTDRWQKFADEIISATLLDQLSEFCDEFLIHAVDVEGKASGIETGLAELLGGWGKKPVTYAGGVRSVDDISLLGHLGKNRLDVTIGSALDLFGGKLKYSEVLKTLA